jgi:hypothetical protein
MSNLLKIAIVIILFFTATKAAEAIGATLEAPTIKDMYFGFVMAGLLANTSIYPEDAPEELVVRARKISNLMMKERLK